MLNIKHLAGLTLEHKRYLEKAGVTSFEKLLEATTTKKDSEALAKKTNIHEELILMWANHADLARIKGIAGHYADLLEAVGVDTVVELAKRNPDHLYELMIKVNNEVRLVKRLPSVTQVEEWITQAGRFNRKLRY
jgi:predicted flap endonuclease-1-like 5' DNA nuclease